MHRRGPADLDGRGPARCRASLVRLHSGPMSFNENVQIDAGRARSGGGG
ncbi:neutral zinc metallopeptidase, partial [Aquicoccus sp. SCR17]|nr:neutral zinc metallopeptidase [Carideicomes alvinocaridis]